MSRDVTPLYIDDLSSFTKSLRHSLSEQETTPTHAALMNIIAKAAGARNYQHLKSKSPTPQASADVTRALRYFDEAGLMTQWPANTKIQGLCLWPFWARLAPRQSMNEKEINAVLKAGCGFGDHVLMRRSLIDHGLVTRETDGSAYLRVEQTPSTDALAMIRSLPNRLPLRVPRGHQAIQPVK